MKHVAQESRMESSTEIAPRRMWNLRCKSRAERAALLEAALPAAETYYNSERFDCVAEAGEVYDDGGLS